jgi:hypothetical protein
LAEAEGVVLVKALPAPDSAVPSVNGTTASAKKAALAEVGAGWGSALVVIVTPELGRESRYSRNSEFTIACVEIEYFLQIHAEIQTPYHLCGTLALSVVDLDVRDVIFARGWRRWSGFQICRGSGCRGCYYGSG